jgi:hypothetical protein
LKKLGPSIMLYEFNDDPNFANFETPTFDTYEDEEVPASKMPGIDDVDDVENYYQYGGAQVRVPIGDEIHNGEVVQPKCERDGTLKG